MFKNKSITPPFFSLHRKLMPPGLKEIPDVENRRFIKKVADRWEEYRIFRYEREGKSVYPNIVCNGNFRGEMYFQQENCPVLLCTLCEESIRCATGSKRSFIPNNRFKW